MLLYTNAKWLEDLQDMELHVVGDASVPLAVLKPDASGRLRPTGGPRMKSSQSYTAEFGHAVAKLWGHNRKVWRNAYVADVSCQRCLTCPTVRQILKSSPADPWLDAEIGAVIARAQSDALAVYPSLIVESLDSDDA
jgi:hypothetical protein